MSLVIDLALDPTTRQRRAADPKASVWVAASAGAGKTKVLTDRVLALLLDGTLPSRILCLTFTKAAAAEMSTRIARRLSNWTTGRASDVEADIAAILGRAPDPPALLRARQLFALVLEAPGGLKIQTLHGFCQTLLKRFPLEAGVAPYFELADERTAAELLAAARDHVLQEARAGHDQVLAEALAAITEQASEFTFDELMREVARERARLQRQLDQAGGAEALIELVYRRVGADPAVSVKDLIEAACADSAFDAPALRAAGRALGAGSDADQGRGQILAAWLGRAPGDRAAVLAAYMKLFLTQEREVRKTLITKQGQAADPAALAALQSEAARLVELARRISARVVAEATAQLLRLAGAMLAAYRRRKEAKALLDYDDLILIARDLLRRPGVAPWVLYKLDGGIDHVLIDEAQDTNQEQWQVVAALVEEFFVGAGARELERTVFAVGDRKQSIFSFQRADPAGFEAMRRHFKDAVAAIGRRWHEVELDTSFRSVAPVLAAVDAVFAEPGAADGVVPDGQTSHHRPHRLGQAGLVELWPAVEPAERQPLERWRPPVGQVAADSPVERLARIIAETIRSWLADGEDLPARGRKVRAGDIMVLVRRRGSFVEHLVRALKDLGVPVAGVDRMVLAEQLAVMDLVALGEFLLLPSDDLTLATVLKSPLIGLDEEQLFEIAHGRGAVSLWQSLQRRRHDHPAFAGAVETLEALLARADFTPPFELFADVLGPGGGRYRLVERLGSEALDPLDEFLSAALAFEATHVPSLQGFLSWLQRGHSEIKRDLEPARDQVRVMTVHGAKGLEAPIVILPDTMQVPRTGPRLLWPEGDEIPLWSPAARLDDGLAAATRAAARRAAEREYRRLLYVAMTRAEDRLYVAGWRTQRGVAGCWYELVERGLESLAPVAPISLPGGLAGAGRRLESPQSVAAAAAGADALPPKPAPALPEWAKRPPAADPDPPRPLAPSRPDGEEPAIRSPTRPEDAARLKRGRLIHRLLQTLPELPRRRRSAAARRWLGRPVNGLGAAEVERLESEVLAVLDHQEFAPLFGPGSRAEVPLTGLIRARDGSTRRIAGQVDRLLVTAEEVLVLDYKSNRPAPTREEDVSPFYIKQMSAYRAILQRIYPGRRVRCVLAWTEIPRLMQLSDARLDAHLP